MAPGAGACSDHAEGSLQPQAQLYHTGRASVPRQLRMGDCLLTSSTFSRQVTKPSSGASDAPGLEARRGSDVPMRKTWGPKCGLLCDSGISRLSGRGSMNVARTAGHCRVEKADRAACNKQVSFRHYHDKHPGLSVDLQACTDCGAASGQVLKEHQLPPSE
jgi:hypothetical protein